MGGGIDMLALPIALVVPTSANRLFLLVTETLGEDDDNKKCDGVRDHCGKGTGGLGDSVLTGDGRFEELADDSGPLMGKGDWGICEDELLSRLSEEVLDKEGILEVLKSESSIRINHTAI